MQTADRAFTDVWRQRSKAPLVALILCMLVASACAERCRDDSDRLAAFEAAWRGDVETMRRLVGKVPALVNARQCLPNRTLTDRLIARYQGAKTTSVLHVSARQGHPELTGFLLSHGARVDARDEIAGTPLHLAARYGHDEAAHVLLAGNATVDARRNGGLTPLHVAVRAGRFPLVKRLLAAGADVNARDDGNWTPLHHAASEGHDNVVRLLLNAGGDPRAVDERGKSPLEYALLKSHDAVVELLRRSAPLR